MKLRAAGFIYIILFGCLSAGFAEEKCLLIQNLHKARGSVILVGGEKADPNVVQINRSWNGAICTATVVNHGQSPVQVARVDLFDIQHGLPGSTPFYGEGFQMLSQSGGTLAAPEDWGNYTDRKHYQLEEPDGLRTVHGMMMLRPASMDQVLLGFSSCRRFDGRISFDAKRLLVSLDCEGLELAPGESWQLEEFF